MKTSKNGGNKKKKKKIPEADGVAVPEKTSPQTTSEMNLTLFLPVGHSLLIFLVLTFDCWPGFPSPPDATSLTRLNPTMNPGNGGSVSHFCSRWPRLQIKTKNRGMRVIRDTSFPPWPNVKLKITRKCHHQQTAESGTSSAENNHRS